VTDLKASPNKSWRDVLPVHPAADLSEAEAGKATAAIGEVAA
jgi:hypothetical protein